MAQATLEPVSRPLDDLATVSGRLRRRQIAREVVLLAVLFGIYNLGRFLSAKHAGSAFLNADALIHFQTRIGLPSEADVQTLALQIPDLAQLANRYYASVHFPLTAIVLVWLLIKRPAEYAKARWSLAALTGLALIGHMLFPLAPPRMLPELGWVDTGLAMGQSVYGADAEAGLANQFAAMPSLHVGWAFLVAVFLIRAIRSRWRWLWIAHPVITFAVVVVTANHYWMDGLVALAMAVPLVLIFDSRRVRRNNTPAGVGQRSEGEAAVASSSSARTR